MRGREPLDNSLYDSDSHRATNKIGVLWTWVTSDRPDATIDDALYMSLWDKSQESSDSSGHVISMELVNIDSGDDLRHMLLIDGSPATTITWDGLGHNNSYVFRWTIPADGYQRKADLPTSPLQQRR